MNDQGIDKTSEGVTLEFKYKLYDAQRKLKKELSDISEAFHGTMRRKFDAEFSGSDIGKSDDDLSSVASFGTESDNNELQGDA